jgi:hypothetical protein
MRALAVLTVASLGLSSFALASSQDAFENQNAWHIQNHAGSEQPASATAAPVATVAGTQDLFEQNNAWHLQNHASVGQVATVTHTAQASRTTPDATGQDMFEQNNAWHLSHRTR